jgi:hypothetical protein
LIHQEKDGKGEQKDVARHVMAAPQLRNQRVVEFWALKDDWEKFWMGRARDGNPRRAIRMGNGDESLPYM